MPSIEDLGLPPEPVGEVDFNAPEPGSFPPQLKVGTYNFVFHLGPQDGASDSDCWNVVERGEQGQPKGKFLEVVHHATTTIEVPDPANPNEKVAADVSLNYQRVNFYKHPQMPNSSGGDLIRALNLRVDGPLTTQAVANLFKQVDGRASYRADIGWRVYCKSCQLEINTHARKKKIGRGEQVQWPRDPQTKEYTEQAECPKCHQKYYGNAEIVRYLLPHGQEASGNGSGNMPFGQGTAA